MNIKMKNNILSIVVGFLVMIAYIMCVYAVIASGLYVGINYIGSQSGLFGHIYFYKCLLFVAGAGLIYPVKVSWSISKEES